MDVELRREVDQNGEIHDFAIVKNPENKVILDKDKIQKVQQYKAEKRSYDNFIDIAGGFSFLLVDTLKDLHSDTRFTDIEKARIMFLGSYCSYESSGRYLFTNNNKYILKKDLQELLEITNKQEFYKFYNKLVDYGIIEEDVVGRFKVKLKWNGKYHFKGKATKNGNKSIDTVKAYDRQIQTLYKEKDIEGKSINTPKNLYILFMVLPFINKESGVLCNQQHNPIEEDCEPLDLKDLCKLLGFERISTLKSKLMNCTLYGTNVFFIGEGIHKRKKYTRIYVNPFVSSRSSKAPNTSLLAMFPDTEKAIVNNLQKKKK